MVDTDEIRIYLEGVLKQCINGRLLSTVESGAGVSQAAQVPRAIVDCPWSPPQNHHYCF